METTLTLRNRLGFNEMTLWKQFCSRRLHLIHTLSLSLRKASEQEEQVRVLAAELCAEYGFDPSAQADFEKLLIAGIQSVRRNQKRSARNPNGNTAPVVEQYAVRTVNSQTPTEARPSQQLVPATQPQPQVQQQPQQPQQSPSQPEPPQQPPQQAPPQPQQQGGLQYQPQQQQYYYQPHIQQLPHIQGSEVQMAPQLGGPSDLAKRGQCPSTPTCASVASSSPSMSHSSQVSNYSMTPVQIVSNDESHMHQSLIARLDVLRSMVGAGSAMWIESHAPQVAHLSAQGVLSTAVATAAVHAKLSYQETAIMRQCATEGPLLEALKQALDPNMSTTRLLERVGALAASLVHGPHLLSALQALCVCLAQATNGVPEEMCKLLSPGTFEKFYLNRNNPKAREDEREGEGGRDGAPLPSPALSAQSNSSLPKVADMYRNSTNSSGSMGELGLGHLSIPRTPTSATMSDSQPRFTPYHNPLPSYEMRPPTIIGDPPRPRSKQSQQQDSRPANTDSDLASYAVTKLPMPRSANFPEPLKAPPLRAQSPSGCPPASGIQFNVPDRFVSLEYNGKILEMTYSPMKATPPTLSEIIDNGRSMFSIPPSTVARVKDLQTKKIIESDAELIDAFTQQQVKLELFLPPPMLVGLPPSPKPAKFTPLAPIFRTST